MRYFLIPLGCATNKADAERVSAVLESIGYTEAASEAEANLIGIVACSIRQSAINRVYTKISKWNKRKDADQLVTFVSGCILPSDEKKFLKIFDLVVKLDQVGEMPKMLQEYGASAPLNFWDIAPKRNSEFKALISIQNGCDKFCTYCAVPYTRGREVSRPSNEIVAEVEKAIEDGYRQITLLGQNVNSYGLDKPSEELTFAELLDRVGDVCDAAPQKIWVHYTSPHPRDMNKDVYEVQAKHKSLAHYLNLPLQSGSTEILRRMNRRYTVEQFMEKLDMAREYMPDITVSTDIIVGFCGETEEQYEETVDAMRRGRFDLAFIAQYSPRPGAVAEKRFPDDVPHIEKKRRDLELTEILKETASANNAKLVGQTLDVLVDAASRKKGKMLARTEGLKSVQFESTDRELIGKFVQVEIVEADAWRLFGELKGLHPQEASD